MGLREKLMERGMKLMSDPRVMKLLSNPSVMNVVMKGFQLRGQAQAQLDQAVKALAHRFHLATEDEVAELRQTIHNLERELERDDR